MWNPDGSLSEMCGNGLRCTMRWILDHGLILDKIATDAGVLQVHNPEAGGEIDLGPADFSPSLIPCDFHGEEFLNQPFLIPLDAENLELRLSAVSFGNPHVVFYGEFGTDDFVKIAKFLQSNPLFPASVNVHQMQIIEQNWVRMQTYERGAGITLACGSGACAVATLHRKLEQLAGRIAPDSYKIEMPGGPVNIRLKPSGHAGLSGAAHIVAKLEIKSPTNLVLGA